MVRHVEFTVASDDEEYKNYTGTLHDNLLDMVEVKINDWLQSDVYLSEDSIISMDRSYDSYEVRPVMCNSGTWYTRHTLTILIWYISDK